MGAEIMVEKVIEVISMVLICATIAFCVSRIASCAEGKQLIEVHKNEEK